MVKYLCRVPLLAYGNCVRGSVLITPKGDRTNAQSQAIFAWVRQAQVTSGGRRWFCGSLADAGLAYPGGAPATPRRRSRSRCIPPGVAWLSRDRATASYAVCPKRTDRRYFAPGDPLLTSCGYHEGSATPGRRSEGSGRLGACRTSGRRIRACRKIPSCAD